jgi:4'-phosphopantetheinyl transferase EntD
MSSLRALFPPHVACAIVLDPEGLAPAPALYPEEAAHLGRAVEKRRREFALGRGCAREALATLGVAPRALVALTEGVCAAVAVLRSRARGVGVDVEVRGRVGPSLYRAIATPRETSWIHEADSAEERAERATRLFSAKEAFYKAQYCVSRAWVGFHDVELTFEEGDAFTVELVVDVAAAFARGTLFHGRVTQSAGHVLSGMVLPP